MSVSIIMTAYRRAEQLAVTLASIDKQTVQPDEIIVVEDGNDGKTEGVCAKYGAKYFCRRNRQVLSFAIPWNIGIRAATSDILILQCAECKFEESDAVHKIIAPILSNPLATTFPNVRSLTQDGNFECWYTHPSKVRDSNRAPMLNFCQGVSRNLVNQIGGFDEAFVDYGLDDDDFELRLMAHGAVFERVDTLVSHQWHPHYASDVYQRDTNEKRYYARVEQVNRGEKPVANEGRDWGNILS